MSALEIFAAALLVLGSFIVFRVLLDALPLEPPAEALMPEEVEEAPPLRRAA